MGDLLKKYNFEVIRMSLLENNYRSDMNVVDGMFDQQEAKIYMLYKLFYLIDLLGNGYESNDNSEYLNIIDKNFRSAMDNDFNTSVAIGNIFEYVNLMNKMINKNQIQEVVDMKYALIKVYATLGLLQQEPKKVIKEIKDKYLTLYDIDENEINEMILNRKRYKDEKKWIEADKIRDDLSKRGIILKDGGKSTEWDIDIPPKLKI